MKIAILISGQLRTIEKTINSINKNLVKPNNADIFISYWDTTEATHKQKKYNFKPINREIIKNVLKPKILQGFKYKNSYNDKIQNVKRKKFIKDLEPVHSKNNLPMLYQFKLLFNLFSKFCKKNNKNYDCIIRLRPDYYFVKKFKINSFIPNTLYHSSSDVDHNFQISDKFAFGDLDVMKYYFLTFDYLPYYWLKKNFTYLNRNQYINNVGERLMYYHFKKSKNRIRVEHFIGPAFILRKYFIADFLKFFIRILKRIG